MSAQKAIVLGDVAVGKTAVLRRYLFDDFVTEHNTTMAHEFSMKMLTGGHRLQLWDSVGQERFTSLTQTYFRNAQIILVIFSVNVRKSFELAQYWINQAREQINTDYKMFLVANKCDLPTRDIKYEEGKGMADDNGIPYFEISAKTKQGMKELFNEVEQIAIAYAQKEKPQDIKAQPIPDIQAQPKKKKLCG